jgi:antirestriction protein ArdC
MRANDLYAEVTQKIIEQLESGTPPWRKPWTAQGTGLPTNAATGKAYRGINVLLLWLAAEKGGWDSGLFGTYRQWQDLGGHVNRGEKGTRIVYWSIVSRTVVDDAGEQKEEKFPFARTYTVFALEQCGGEALNRFRAPVPDTNFVDFDPAETAIAATAADIRHGGGQAYYNRRGDYIRVPQKETFASQAGYYGTVLHELTHWTGHNTRLDRLPKLARFWDESYAVEELVAELGAAFLTATLGVPLVADEGQSAGYIGRWLEVLKADNRAIFTASTAASAAADFVMAFSRTVEPEEVVAG